MVSLPEAQHGAVIQILDSLRDIQFGPASISGDVTVGGVPAVINLDEMMVTKIWNACLEKLIANLEAHAGRSALSSSNQSGD